MRRLLIDVLLALGLGAGVACAAGGGAWVVNGVPQSGGSSGSGGVSQGYVDTQDAGVSSTLRGEYGAADAALSNSVTAARAAGDAGVSNALTAAYRAADGSLSNVLSAARTAGEAGLSNAVWGAFGGAALTGGENTFTATQRFERVLTKHTEVAMGWVPAQAADFHTLPMQWMSMMGIFPWMDGATSGWYAAESSEGMDHGGYFSLKGEGTVFRVRWDRRRKPGGPSANSWAWYTGSYDGGEVPTDWEYHSYTSPVITNAYDGMSMNFDGLYSGTTCTDVLANVVVEFPGIVTNTTWVANPVNGVSSWAVLVPGGGTNWVTISNGWIQAIRATP